MAGAFVLAFMIPNLFRRLLGEGAFMRRSFLFSRNRKKPQANRPCGDGQCPDERPIVVLAGVVGGVAGHHRRPEQGVERETTLMLELLRWVFPYLFFICLAAVAMGMLNARAFFLPALGALILNVVMITSVLWLAPRWGDALNDQIFALAMACCAGGAAALSIAHAWREGFRPQWISWG